MEHTHSPKITQLSLPGAILFIALIALPISSHAVDFHVGLGLGPATIEHNNAFDDGSLSNIDTDDDVLAVTVFGEMEFNRFVRLEFGILDGGFATVDADSTGAFFPYYWFAGPVEVKYSVGGIKLGAVGSFPLAPNDSVKLLIKGGMIAWGSVVRLSDFWGDENDNDAGVDPYYGIGLEFDISRLMAIRLQHERFEVESDSDWFAKDYEFDYASTTMGVLFRF